MRAKKSLISLPRPKELRSNRLEDIQDFLQRAFDELDRQWKLLWQDVSTIEVDPDGWIYFGGKDVDGSWRVGRVGNNWEMQRRESGTYVKKGASTA